jgi:hypothetical protein
MRYDWSKAPKGAIAGVREEDGSGVWVRTIPTSMYWVQRFLDMDPSAILDDSGDWRESMELRPKEIEK